LKIVFRLALFPFSQYIARMLSRVHNSRGRPINKPAAFIHPCRPTVVAQPPRGPGWAHELKHDGYRLQIHVRDGRVRLYTINGADWSKRYPLIIQDASRIEGSAILDAEVVWLGLDGAADFDALHSRVNDARASACAFDLLMLNGDDLRRKPFSERKAMLRKVLRRTRHGIQYVEHTKATAEKCLRPSASLALKELFQKN
jgi:bifunctional non-homologous end joining protein LigD